MKKIVSSMLVICLIFTLMACGGEKELTEEQLQKYEEYALATTGEFTFLSSQLMNGIFVNVPDNMANFLKENVGDVSHLELDGAEALVIDLVDTTFHGYVLGGENEILYKYTNDARLSPAAASPIVSSSSGDTLSELRKAYARIAVELDQYDTQYDPESHVFATINELKQELGDAHFLDVRYIDLEDLDASLVTRAEKYLQELYKYSLYIKKQEALEGKDSAEESDDKTSDDDIEFVYNLQIAKRDLQRELNQTERTIDSVEEGALQILSENDGFIQEIKKNTKENNYMDDILFYQLCEQYDTLKTYANHLRLKEAQEKILKLYDQLFTEDADVAVATLEKYTALAENSSLQNLCCIDLAKAIMAEQSYRQEHAQEIADYEAAKKEIQSRYKDTSYEDDMDYLKLGIVYEKMLSELDANSGAVKKAEEALQDATVAEKQIEEEKTLQIENIILRNHKNAETALLNEFIAEQSAVLLLSDEENDSEEANVLGWQKMNVEFIEKMNNERKIYTPSSPSSGRSGGSSSGSGSSGGSSSGDQSFEEWLKDNDPESYEYHQELSEWWDSLDD